MKELTIEQKAKAYDEAIEIAKSEYQTHKSFNGFREMLTRIFPELKKSEGEDADEKVRKALIKLVTNHASMDLFIEYDIHLDEALAWLEKQDKIDKTFYQIAEKEKGDFVGDGFIECRKSFNEFTEDNSYWLEYVGNDTYIGRSDNILNKKFHITPRQLYRLFTQQHCQKEDNANEGTNAPTEYGKYVDECLNEASKHFFSEGEDKYSVADLFYAGVRCGKSWLEKQGEKKPYGQREECLDCQFNYAGECKGSCSMKKDECEEILEDATIDGNEDGLIAETLRNKVEPKFKVGDWITDWQLTCKVLSITGKSYELHLYNDDYCHFETDVKRIDKHYHLWTIKDAKDGDVLATDKGVFIYAKVLYNKPYAYCGVDKFGVFKDNCLKNNWSNSVDNIHPATKKQHDFLFQKMREAGYEWDVEKKELKKIKKNNMKIICPKCNKDASNAKDYSYYHNRIRYICPHCHYDGDSTEFEQP